MSAEATNISKLSIITEAKSGEAVKSLQSLASALSKLKTASKGEYKGIVNASNAIQTLMKQIHSIKDADIQKLSKLANAMAKVNGISLRVSQMRDAAKNASKVTAPEKTVSDAIGGAASATRDAGGSAVSLGGEDSYFDRSSKEYQEYLRRIESETKRAESEWKKAEAANAKRSQEAMKRLSAPFKKIGQFFSSIGRIAMYRLIRRGLQIVSEGIKEGYQNALEWSRLNNTSLYPSMMKLKTAALVMKNQLGAAAGELLQTLQPALIQLAEVVTNIAEQFANMFAVMGGRGQYMRAKRNIDTLTEAQGKLNRTILAFDEINKLNGDNGYGNVSINDMFEMVDVNVKEANTLKATLTAIAAIVAGIRLTSFIMDLKDAIGWAGKLATALGGSGAASGAGGIGSALGGGAGGGLSGGVAGAAGSILGWGVFAVVVAKMASDTIKECKEQIEKDRTILAQWGMDLNSPNAANALDNYYRATYGMGRWDYFHEDQKSRILGMFGIDYALPTAKELGDPNTSAYLRDVTLGRIYGRGTELLDPIYFGETAGWAVRDNPLLNMPTTEDGWAARMPESQEITLTILDQNGTVLSRDPLSNYYADSIRVGSVIVGNGSVR